jgi:uncharacterized repeat protein (TIGR01451 family)
MSRSGPLAVGEAVSYRITATNIGADASQGPLTVVDQLPAGLTYQGFSGSGWTCADETPLIRCAHGGLLPAGASLPPLQLAVQVGASALPGVTNTARVDAADNRGDPADASVASTLRSL